MASVEAIEGIGPAYAARLTAQGVRTTGALLARGSTKRGREDLAAVAGLSESLILEWVNRADLMRIKGVGSQFSDLLEAAGVDSVPELANRNPANLADKMEGVNDASIERSGRSIVRRVPSAKEVTGWVAQARILPRVVTH